MGNKDCLCCLASLLIVILLSGCSSTPYGKQPIQLDELEGIWKGYAEAGGVYGNYVCNIKFPMAFKVQSGRAVSLCTMPECVFDVPLKPNGGIKFKYRKALNFSTETAGTLKKDIVFTGQLSTDEGQGTFYAMGCSGKWYVNKSTQSIQKSVESYRASRLPKYIHILEKQVVWEYGKQKYIVNKGDVLVVLASKICRTGYGECWKVKELETGEIGYVSAVHMKRAHRLTYE